jgi:CHAT domain-containing protein
MENPMLRSGLALAGANTWLARQPLPAEAEDGLLTAEDALGLNLLDTELVVLSAWETGLGDVRVGEGVFGLRRAFVLAGTKTLVMSLWKVPDIATAILMERFYDNLLTRTLPRDESLREAQEYVRTIMIGDMRPQRLTTAARERLAKGNDEMGRELERLAQQPDDHRPFSHTYFWGAFICQGDPSPLPPIAPPQ